MSQARRHRTLLDILRERARSQPDTEATRHLRGDERVATTWAEWERRSRTFAAALLALRIQPGERVAILSSTRVEFAWLDVGASMAGAVTVPIFPTEVPSRCAAVLADSGARLVLAEDPLQARKLVAVRDRLPALQWVVCLDTEATDADGEVVGMGDLLLPEGDGWIQTLDAFRELGEGHLAGFAEELDRRMDAIAPDDLATIHYTPGTEGEQKGVMLTHRALAVTAASLSEALPLDPSDVQLLYLPLAQAFARLCLAVGVHVGMVTAFARSYRTVLEDCATFEPTFLCGVPRLFEKVQRRVEADHNDLPGIQRTAADWALGMASRTAEGGGDGLLGGLQRRVAERFVFHPMRQVFGGRLRFAISGGAPLRAETARFFRCHGLEVVQGYGMTETSACTHIAAPDDNVPGTVGRPLSWVRCRLAEDGEILVQGPGCTRGYWNRPAATADFIDAEGWLHTGDLGVVSDDGRLTITDRKRDVIITANGKAIAPRPIIDALRAAPLVDEVLIHGEGRSFLSALVTLDREAVARYAAEHGSDAPYEELVRSAAIFEEVERIVEGVNATLPSHENIRKFAILASGLTAEQGELTPTRRLRRRVATERHRALLDSFYSEQY